MGGAAAATGNAAASAANLVSTGRAAITGMAKSLGANGMLSRFNLPGTPTAPVPPSGPPAFGGALSRPGVRKRKVTASEVAQLRTWASRTKVKTLTIGMALALSFFGLLGAVGAFPAILSIILMAVLIPMSFLLSQTFRKMKQGIGMAERAGYTLEVQGQPTVTMEKTASYVSIGGLRFSFMGSSFARQVVPLVSGTSITCVVPNVKSKLLSTPQLGDWGLVTALGGSSLEVPVTAQVVGL